MTSTFSGLHFVGICKPQALTVEKNFLSDFNNVHDANLFSFDRVAFVLNGVILRRRTWKDVYKDCGYLKKSV